MPHRNHGPSSCTFAGAFSFALLASGCAGFPDKAPATSVVLDNDYPSDAGTPLVVYEAFWLDVAFPSPVAPGASSDAQGAIPASANTAYVLLAPGWDPASTTPPTSLVVMQSRGGFGVALGDTLHIHVDDGTFEGNCAAGSHLTQGQADFLTQIVFGGAFGGAHYDAATCTTTREGDAGAP
jgi:hypothetical protein